MDDGVKAEMERAIQQMMSTDPNTNVRGARDIYSLASNTPMTREPLARDARVIPRLVALLKGGSTSSRHSLQYSLAYLAEVGTAVQLQIAYALDAAALTVLDNHPKKHLLEILVRKPNLDALLAAKRGKPQVTALLDDESTDVARRDAMIEVLCSVVDGSAVFLEGISQAEARDVLLRFPIELADHIHLKGVREIVLDTVPTASISDNIRAAANVGEEKETAAKRRCVVLWLANVIQSNETKRLEIVAKDGVAALIAELQREVYRADAMSEKQKLCSSEMKRQIASAFAVVMTEGNARSKFIACGGLKALIGHCDSSDGEDTKVAFQVLEQFMLDEKTHASISNIGGISSLVRHLRHGSHDQLRVKTLALIRSLCESSNSFDKEANVRIFGECKGPAELSKLCQPSVLPALRTSAESLLQDLTGLIPRLLQLTDIDSLYALEVMTRVSRNCEVIVDSRGFHSLNELANRGHSEVQAPTLRIFANLACRSSARSALIGALGWMPNLMVLVLIDDEPTDVKEAAAMALRNLANETANRTRIGRSGVVPRMVRLIQTRAASPRLREAIVGLLGNLARQNHRFNQHIIAGCNGVAVLVEFARTATNAHQRQTVSMALWVLVKENGVCRDQFLAADGIQAISKIEQLNETKSQPWAKRILSVVRPIAHSRS